MKKYSIKLAMNKVLLLAVMSSVLYLTGCASSSSGGDHLIPQQGLTVSQIYAQSGQGESAGSPYGTMQDEDLMAARAQAAPSINHGNTAPTFQPMQPMSQPAQKNGRFQLVGNPSIPIYIYPHLVAMGSDEVPVDGYETAFFLYTKNHYALPWEKY